MPLILKSCETWGKLQIQTHSGVRIKTFRPNGFWHLKSDNKEYCIKNLMKLNNKKPFFFFLHLRFWQQVYNNTLPSSYSVFVLLLFSYLLFNAFFCVGLGWVTSLMSPGRLTTSSQAHLHIIIYEFTTRRPLICWLIGMTPTTSSSEPS